MRKEAKYISLSVMNIIKKRSNHGMKCSPNNFGRFVVFMLLFLIMFGSCTLGDKHEIHSESTKIVKEYYSNKALQSVKQYNNQGQFDGEQKKFYRNGNCEVVSHYLNGRREGGMKGYFQNGKMEFCSFYKNNKLEGTSTWYYYNGAVKEIANYNNGIYFGEQYY